MKIVKNKLAKVKGHSLARVIKVQSPQEAAELKIEQHKTIQNKKCNNKIMYLEKACFLWDYILSKIE